MGETKIEWTDRSVNPIRATREIHDAVDGGINRVRVFGHYCEKISPGCQNCYASRMQVRFHMPAFDRARGNVDVFFDPERMAQVNQRKIPTKWFWCDMTDMFGAWVPDAWLDQMFTVMAATPQHTHQVLTKRTVRMKAYSDDLLALTPAQRARRFVASAGLPTSAVQCDDVPWPLPNVWMMTSIENQPTADQRLTLLRATPAAFRAVSYEPALDHVNLDLSGIDLLIMGGESNPGARPFDMDWARDVHAQCQRAGVRFFLKQMGAVVYDSALTASGRSEIVKLKAKKGNDMSEWPLELRVRELPR